MAENKDNNNGGEKAPIIDNQKEAESKAKQTDKMKDNLKIDAEFDKKKVSIELTEMEAQTAFGICKDHGVKDVIVMKHHNGGSLFFTDVNNANACQDRHKFDYSFTVSRVDLNKYLTK